MCAAPSVFLNTNKGMEPHFFLMNLTQNQFPHAQSTEPYTNGSQGLALRS
jgi:hypothetical protein